MPSPPLPYAVPRAAVLLVLSCLACAQAPSKGLAPSEGLAPSADAAASIGTDRFGDGFAVWESNRGGDWRIWTKRLDGSGLARSSPEEGERQHVCPHLSPDGTRLVYLSVGPEARDVFPEQGLEGALHLRAVDGSWDRVLLAEARAYGDHRAAVWRNDRELIAIGGDGHTWSIDVESGARERLTATPMPRHGWLVDPRLRHAFTAADFPTIAPYDAVTKTVAGRSDLGGCEPYVSFDGRWGLWVAGGGGPVKRLDLATGESATLVRKGDPRLPEGWGYVYFPMLSKNGHLLAFGASAGEHDHNRANYDVFVAQVDPRSLEIEGEIVRLTDHPGTDRFPDLWQAPLPLGRHAGEAPFTLRLEAPAPGDWRWSFGEGGAARGSHAEHTYTRPGSFTVRAEGRGRIFEGLVRVEAARPPRAVAARLAEAGSKIVVAFDEEVRLPAEGVRMELGSGAEIAGSRLGEDGRSLEIELKKPLATADTLHLAGPTDTAGRPNRLEPVSLSLEPPRWPSRTEDLVFLWQTAASPNLVYDEKTGTERSEALVPHGRGRLDHDHAMVLDRGAFSASRESAARVARRCQATNELSLEVTVTPDPVGDRELSWIVSSGRGPRARNFALGQVGETLLLRVRTGSTGPDADRPQLDLFPLPAGTPSHVVVTYEPGSSVGYLNGEKRFESGAVRQGFWAWKEHPLRFGDDASGGHGWEGTLEGVAVYCRALGPAEVRENALRSRLLREERPEVPRLVVRAVLTETSRAPTLREISPYRQALMVSEYRVEKVLRGSLEGERVRVAHWAILDGEAVPGPPGAGGASRKLVLEPFGANPQLESLYLADTLPEDWDVPLFYLVSP